MKKSLLFIGFMTVFSLMLVQTASMPSSFVGSSTVSAQAPSVEDADGDGDNCTERILGLPVWWAYLDVGEVRNSEGEVIDECGVKGPAYSDGSMKWESAAGLIALAIFEILLRLGAVVAVGYVIYGGFRFITSQGEPENAASARSTVINAVIGLVIAMASASIVSFLANRLT